MHKSDRLTATQRRFLATLLASRDVRAAAGTAGISEASAYRYLRDPVFRAELSARLDGLLRQVTGGLADDAATARQTLTAVCNDPLASPSARVAAAGQILATVLRLAEFTDVTGRLEALEQRLAENDATRPRT